MPATNRELKAIIKIKIKTLLRLLIDLFPVAKKNLKLFNNSAPAGQKQGVGFGHLHHTWDVDPFIGTMDTFRDRPVAGVLDLTEQLKSAQIHGLKNGQLSFGNDQRCPCFRQYLFDIDSGRNFQQQQTFSGHFDDGQLSDDDVHTAFGRQRQRAMV